MGNRRKVTSGGMARMAQLEGGMGDIDLRLASRLQHIEARFGHKQHNVMGGKRPSSKLT